MCFLYTAEGWILFTSPSSQLCLFKGKLNPLIFRDINDQWLLIPVNFLVEVVVSFPSLGFALGNLFPVFSWMQLATLD